MGNFVGHILPGSLFIIFSILWTINLLRFYFRNTRRKHGISEYELSFESKKLNRPLESMILIAILPIAMLGEYLTAFNQRTIMCADNLQHITMYLFFFIISVVNLLEIYSFTPLPSIVDPLYGFAFGAETLLLYFHTHGQGPVEQHLHKLLTFASFMCAMASFFSGIFRKDVVVQLAKPLFVLLQGTWFIQIAFLIYSPTLSLFPPEIEHHHHHHPENHAINSINQTTANHSHDHMHDHMHDHSSHDDPNAPHNIMVTTAYFCWHFAFCLMTIYTLAFACRKKFYKQSDLLNEKYQRLLEETAIHDQELVN